ncbi:MAG: diguanylate cyclase domain protein [Frankiales bacterium]|nr:diguanylate cyclase domain protein [Frankiales bacterium]
MSTAEVRDSGMFAASAVGQAMITTDGVILDVNRALADLLGYRPEDMVGRPVLSFAHPDESEWDAGGAARLLASDEPGTAQRTRRYVHSSGRIVWTRFSVTAVHGSDGDFFACAAEDVTAYMVVQRQNSLLLEVLGLLGDAPDFTVGVESVLARLCADSPWSMAQLWLPAGDDVLACAEAWYGSAGAPSVLRTASLNKAAVRGEGLIGRAWQTGRRTWWDAADPDSLLRAVAAASDGLRSAVAIPLSAYGGAVGVIELFSAADVAPHDPLAHLAVSVAAHLGPTLSRRRDEQTIRDSERRLRAVTAGAPVAVLTADASGRIVGWNAAAEVLFGISGAAAMGRPASALVLPELRDGVELYLAAAPSRGTDDVRFVNVTCVRADGVPFPAEVSVSHWEWLGAPHYTAIFRDVSAQVDADRLANQHSERLAAIVDVQNEVLRATVSVSGVQQLVVGRAEALFGSDGAVLEMLEGTEMVYVAAAGTASPHIGLRLRASQSLSGLCIETGVPQVCADVSGDPRINVEACRLVGIRAMVVVPLFDGNEVVGTLKVISALPRSWSNDDVWTLQLLASSIGTAMTIAERHEHALARAEKALYDDLTGLPRRELLTDRMRHAHLRMKRHALSSATFFIDLDGFKSINDNFGHAVGDELLVAVARRLSGTLRDSDTAARLGGDEFVVFCEDVRRVDADDEPVRVISHRLVAALNEPYDLSEHRVRVTASVGVAISCDADEPAEELLRRADGAMYQAKRGGKARASFAPPQACGLPSELSTDAPQAT